MTENDQDRQIEQILRAYRPAAPPDELRDRVLASAETGLAPDRTWRGWAFRGAVAAAIVVSVALNLAADRTMATVNSTVGIGPVRWTEDAEQAAQLLDGDGWGRRYIALRLMASTGKANSGRLPFLPDSAKTITASSS